MTDEPMTDEQVKNILGLWLFSEQTTGKERDHWASRAGGPSTCGNCMFSVEAKLRAEGLLEEYVATLMMTAVFMKSMDFLIAYLGKSPTEKAWAAAAVVKVRGE